MTALILTTAMSLGQFATCPGGQCGPIQTAAHNVVGYAANVGQAIVQPLRGGLFPRLREAIQNRPRLFSRCR